MEENHNGIGTGTLLLSFITGLAAGIAAALLISANKENNSSAAGEQDDQLFI